MDGAHWSGFHQLQTQFESNMRIAPNPIGKEQQFSLGGPGFEPGLPNELRNHPTKFRIIYFFYMNLGH